MRPRASILSGSVGTKSVPLISLLMVEFDVMLCVCAGVTVTDNVDLYVSGAVCVGVKHHLNE